MCFRETTRCAPILLVLLEVRSNFQSRVIVLHVIMLSLLDKTDTSFLMTLIKMDTAAGFKVGVWLHFAWNGFIRASLESL